MMVNSNFFNIAIHYGLINAFFKAINIHVPQKPKNHQRLPQESARIALTCLIAKN